MTKCRGCGVNLNPEKEYFLNGRVICEDCCMEERIPYARKPAWQYIRSIKSEYLISSPQRKQNNRAYRKYINDHPEEFKDQPRLGMCGTMWFRMVQEGKATSKDMENAGQKMRERWEKYHLNKALSLGFDIDIKKFKGAGFDNFRQY